MTANNYTDLDDDGSAAHNSNDTNSMTESYGAVVVRHEEPPTEENGSMGSVKTSGQVVNGNIIYSALTSSTPLPVFGTSRSSSSSSSGKVRSHKWPNVGGLMGHQRRWGKSIMLHENAGVGGMWVVRDG